MAIKVFDEKSLMNSLFSASANCLKCGASISAFQGQSGAQDRGIKESNVVVCPQCSTVFTMVLAPGRLTLLADVTNKYAKKK